MYTFGIIGTGRMGSALATALAASASASQLVLANRTPEKAAALAAALGCAHGSAATVAAEARFILLGVKPQGMAALLDEIRPVLAARRTPYVLVTMAAGLQIEAVRRLSGQDCPVIRILPNTPVRIGAGVILVSADAHVAAADLATLTEALAPAGRVLALPEEQMDAGCSVAGCGPAFVYLFLQGIAKGGVAAGLSPEAALQYAEEMVRGAAQLALSSGEDPAKLCADVCSPGGSTIEGVRRLQENGFEEILSQAVQASFARNRELGTLASSAQK